MRSRGRSLPPKAEKQASSGGGPGKSVKVPRQSKPAPAKEDTATPASEQPPQPKDASRGEKEGIVYLDLSELHPFQNHPFGVWDDVDYSDCGMRIQAGITFGVERIGIILA